jgi:hypothetical protein
MKSDNSIKEVSTITRIEYKRTVKNRQLIFKDQDKKL